MLSLVQCLLRTIEVATLCHAQTEYVYDATLKLLDLYGVVMNVSPFA